MVSTTVTDLANLPLVDTMHHALQAWCIFCGVPPDTPGQWGQAGQNAEHVTVPFRGIHVFRRSPANTGKRTQEFAANLCHTSCCEQKPSLRFSNWCASWVGHSKNCVPHLYINSKSHALHLLARLQIPCSSDWRSKAVPEGEYWPVWQKNKYEKWVNIMIYSWLLPAKRLYFN